MFYLIVVVAALVAPVWSNSAGAPVAVCKNGLVPEHGVGAQSSSPPYSLSGGSSVKAGQQIDLTLSGDEFLGWAIQAHSADNKPIGAFKPDSQSQTINCSGADNTLTHKKLKAPIKSLKIKWQAPEGHKGPVTFHATVVKNGGTFWVGKVKKDVSVA
ncbi:defense protein l(2)34Fc [Episyrphus balteatus]|uniref:defense protein l(2)34Fc n=1 Tax=Episyrphus balteatus TaxID=286459 RepID=UPI0024864A5C|nr:defense protein l(2)34Fc [Episyrphus balteatus]XP_055848536.1 defense protein l(2)34Fc [Episyrphus balteatus]